MAKSSPIQGTGCFALRRFVAGEIIGEYTGERISCKEADKRYAEEDQFYIFMVEDGTCIDPRNDDNPIKFINHSCNPNCESFEQDGKVFIKAIRTIRPGRELAYDYNVHANDEDELVCNCGALRCRGTMRAYEEV